MVGHMRHELGHALPVRVTVASAVAGDGILAIPLGLVVDPVVPHPHHATGAVAEVLPAPLGADHGVVAPVVRGVVALLIGGIDATGKLQCTIDKSSTSITGCRSRWASGGHAWRSNHSGMRRSE